MIRSRRVQFAGIELVLSANEEQLTVGMGGALRNGLWRSLYRRFGSIAAVEDVPGGDGVT